MQGVKHHHRDKCGCRVERRKKSIKYSNINSPRQEKVHGKEMPRRMATQRRTITTTCKRQSVVGLPGEFTGRGFNRGDSMIRKMYVYDEEMMQYTMLLVGSKKTLALQPIREQMDIREEEDTYMEEKKYNLQGCDAAKFVGN